MVSERRKNASFIVRFIAFSCFVPLATLLYDFILMKGGQSWLQYFLATGASAFGLVPLWLSHTVLWETKE